MSDCKINFFDNVGYLEYEFSEEDLAPVKKEIAKIQQDYSKGIAFNDELVGNIDKEFKLAESKEHIEKLMNPFVSIFEENYKYLESFNFCVNNHPLILETPWVNFQEKYEFNPIHTHSGLLSYVIWIKIPYTKEDELLKAPGKNIHSKVAGDFSFVFVNALGRVSKKEIPYKENKMLLFPSGLNHMVYPYFSTDEARISVSGNFKVNV